MKKIAIFGTSGFIGSSLARALKGENYVMEFNSHDIEQNNNKTNLNFDLIIYGCEPSFSSLYNDQLIKKLKKRSNIFFKNYKGHVLYLSTTLVYENQLQKIPLHENLLLNPISNYGIFKANQEKNFLKRGMTVFRLSNVIGSGMSDKTLIAKIIRQFQEGNIIIELNETKSYVNYVDIEDVIKAVQLFLKKKPIEGNIYNIASKDAFRIDKIVEMVARSFGTSSWKLHANNNNTSTAKKMIIPTTKFNRYTGWKQIISLEKSILNMLKNQNA
ncbi:NAD(P)-dependent oxidoreductase [Alphaproteobacteria bacterium]|nr:NAD(P)-dependent oxidoreductase [Alphaproteobacteria bacterium]